RGGEDAREVREEEVVLDQLPDGLGALAPGDLEELVERQREPGRAKDGEPGDAVAEMRERAGERIQVLHDLLLAQALDLDGAVADARAFEPRDDVGERIALAHEDGGASSRPFDELDDALCFGAA